MMKNILLFCALIVLFPVLTAAQSSAFNFQGRLNDGANPANGQYDLQFKLFTAITGGTQIGSVAERPNTTLINGVFSVNLDFGETAFNNPESLFIEIGVKPANSPNAFTILGPRQQLTVVPFAVRSRNSTFADLATNATNATNAQSALSAQNALTLITIPGAEFVTKTNGGADFIRNSTTTQSNSNFNISGNGVVGNNLSVGGNVLMDGDIRQLSTSGGAVKAMAIIRVTRTGFPNPNTATAIVARCFSGVALPSAPNCGITIGTVSLSDRVQVNFGFPVSSRFISLTGVNDTVSFISFPNATTVEVDDTTTNGGSSEFFIYVF